MESDVSRGKIIPIGRTRQVRERLVETVIRVMARDGFKGLNVGVVAREAGVDRAVVGRYFDGLRGLVEAAGRTRAFWPDAGEVRELAGLDEGETSRERLLAGFFRGTLRALLKRPPTLDILAWELAERNQYSRLLDYPRVRAALEYFEQVGGDIPEDLDFSAVVAVLGGGTIFLAVRSRLSGHFGGLDLWDEPDVRRVEGALSALLAGLFREPGAGGPR